MSQLSSFIRQMRLHIRNFGFVDHVANLPSVDFRLPATILKALFINRQTLAVDILPENAGDHPDMFQEGRHGPEGPFNIVFLGLQQRLQRIAVANATNKSEMGSVPLFNHAEDTRATGAADQCGIGNPAQASAHGHYNYSSYDEHGLKTDQCLSVDVGRFPRELGRTV